MCANACLIKDELTRSSTRRAVLSSSAGRIVVLPPAIRFRFFFPYPCGEPRDNAFVRRKPLDKVFEVKSLHIGFVRLKPNFKTNARQVGRGARNRNEKNYRVKGRWWVVLLTFGVLASAT